MNNMNEFETLGVASTVKAALLLTCENGHATAAQWAAAAAERPAVSSLEDSKKESCCPALLPTVPPETICLNASLHHNSPFGATPWLPLPTSLLRGSS